MVTGLCGASEMGSYLPCGVPGNGQISCRGLRWHLPHVRVAGKMRGKLFGGDEDKAEG